MPAIEIRPLSPDHLPRITAIHMQTFPKSAMTALGELVVARYYGWLFDPAHIEAYIAGAWQGDRLVGFNFAGRYRGALSGFLQQNRTLLMQRVLLRPWLIVTNELFLSRLVQGINVLSWRRRAVTKAPTAEQQARQAAYQRGFGILAIAVDPGAQGMGVGRLLMDDAETEARRRGVAVMNLSVAQDNAKAIRFYEGLGWTKVLDDGVWQGNMVKHLR